MGKEQMLAIVGTNGLYIGTWQRRVDAIAEHVHDMRWFEEPEVSRFAIGGKLSPEQAKIWRRCQSVGDRAVKVTVTWNPQ